MTSPVDLALDAVDTCDMLLDEEPQWSEFSDCVRFSLVVNGWDVPPALRYAVEGEIFTVAVVRTDRFGLPLFARRTHRQPRDILAMSHTLPKQTEFMLWAAHQAGYDAGFLDATELTEIAVKLIYEFCGIGSRAEFMHETPEAAAARARFNALHKLYHRDHGRNAWEPLSNRRKPW